MAKKKAEGFHIASPGIRTIYLGEGRRQKARFIELGGGFGKQQLTDDIRSGAQIYKPLEETLGLKPTKYNVISAGTEEDGIRAVEYIAGIHSQQADYSEFEISDDVFEFSIEDDEDNEWGEYNESFNRIPIIDFEELKALDGGNSTHIGMGNFSLEMIGVVNNVKPWWMNCTDNSVCVILNRAKQGSQFGGSAPEQDFDCLSRFAENDHVYILVIDEGSESEDYSITRLVLDYTANHYRVDKRKDAVSAYHSLLLVEQAKRHGFTFDDSMDVQVLTERLSRIDRQYPCAMFGKIMDSLIQNNANKTLGAGDFDKLGLDRLAGKAGRDDAGSMDSDLVGMDDVKKQVKNIVNMLRYEKMRKAKNIKSSGYHNVHMFIGAPGTAKTTVARMMTKMMQSEGLIGGDRFVSVSGAQLKGEYVGQTVPKVRALFQNYDAIFIDEAYSLTSSDTGRMDSYSQEALAQLAVELEEHTEDKLVIFAGYGGKSVSKKNNLMKKFLEANPGISSRINSTVFFDSYSSENMVEIVHRLADLSTLSFPKDQDKVIADYFSTRVDAEDFGNGREARVFLEQCERSVAERISHMDKNDVTDNDLNTVTGDDIRYAISELKERRESEKPCGKFGFV